MSPSPKRLLLVDTPSYFYRAFHAIRELRSPAGEPTNAIYGVVNMLRKLRQDFPADYIACVLDPKGKTFRDEIYPEYKATRQAMPEDLAMQIEPLLETIRALGWPVVVVDGVEADDVIATLVTHAEKAHGWDSVISTGDKDLTQLVTDKVLWVNTMAVPIEKLGPEGVKAKFGVPPEKIVDYLALIGDAVDNVPGVDKVGPKTACKLIEQYGSLEEVIAHADEVKGVVGENLRKAKEWLPTGRRLLTVKRDVALPFEVESLVDRGPDVEKLAALYGRFGFRTLRDALVKQEDAAEGGAAPGKAAPGRGAGGKPRATRATSASLPRRSSPRPTSRRSSRRATTRRCSMPRRSSAGRRGSRPRPSRASIPRPRASIPWRRTWSASRSARRRARRPTFRSRIATRARRRSSRCRRCSRASLPGSRTPRR
jgi:DNA polymerase-1